MYERYGTYEIAAYGGLAAKAPNLATLFVITVLSLIGLPMLNGFVGEFLVLSSGFATHTDWGIAATAGVILSAAYMLWMVQRVFYGPDSPMVHRYAALPREHTPRLPKSDLVAREQIALWPVAVLMLIMGVASPFWIRAIDGAMTPLSHLLRPHPHAAVAHAPATAPDTTTVEPDPTVTTVTTTEAQ
jgi:NADH-quinone oxidoreductase subunit M